MSIAELIPDPVTRNNVDAALADYIAYYKKAWQTVKHCPASCKWGTCKEPADHCTCENSHITGRTCDACIAGWTGSKCDTTTECPSCPPCSSVGVTFYNATIPPTPGPAPPPAPVPGSACNPMLHNGGTCPPPVCERCCSRFLPPSDCDSCVKANCERRPPPRRRRLLQPRKTQVECRKTGARGLVMIGQVPPECNWESGGNKCYIMSPSLKETCAGCAYQLAEYTHGMPAGWQACRGSESDRLVSPDGSFYQYICLWGPNNKLQ